MLPKTMMLSATKTANSHFMMRFPFYCPLRWAIQCKSPWITRLSTIFTWLSWTNDSGSACTTLAAPPPVIIISTGLPSPVLSFRRPCIIINAPQTASIMPLAMAFGVVVGNGYTLPMGRLRLAVLSAIASFIKWKPGMMVPPR